MEKDGAVVLATERYGYAESWKYVAKDGVLKRRRDSEGGPTGNTVIGFFKVSVNIILYVYSDCSYAFYK